MTQSQLITGAVVDENANSGLIVAPSKKSAGEEFVYFVQQLTENYGVTLGSKLANARCMPFSRDAGMPLDDTKKPNRCWGTEVDKIDTEPSRVISAHALCARLVRVRWTGKRTWNYQRARKGFRATPEHTEVAREWSRVTFTRLSLDG